MNNLQNTNSPGTSSNKVLDKLKNTKNFDSIIILDKFKNEDIKYYSLLKVNAEKKKFSIEKNDRWEYRITKVNYDVVDYSNKDYLEKQLLIYKDQDISDEKTKQIKTFINQPLEEISYYWNDTSLYNWFLPVEQNSYVDYNRNYISVNNEWIITSVRNQLTRKIHLPKWDIERLWLKFPEQTEVEINTLEDITPLFKEFINQIDKQTDEYTLKDVYKQIISRWSNVEWWKNRIKDLFLISWLNQKEIINKLKDEYWNWWGCITIWSDWNWWEDHSPWLWIMYTLDNWQVFPFSWKKVYDIYCNEYSPEKLLTKSVNKKKSIKRIKILEEKVITQFDIDKLNKENTEGFKYFISEEERDEVLNKIKKDNWVDKFGNALSWEAPLWSEFSEKWKECYNVFWHTWPYNKDSTTSEKISKISLILPNKWKQISMFVEEDKNDSINNKKLDGSINLEDVDNNRDENIFEINKKIRFWMIKNNSMWELVLEKQIKDKTLKEFIYNQLESIRVKINSKQFITSTIPELKALYEYYDLSDVGNSEFKNIFNSTNRDYIKWAFQIRFYDIVKKINNHDNPVQTLDSYFSEIRIRKVDFSQMDLIRFKKVVSAMTIIYNHDLLNLPKREIWWLIKTINVFMRWAKSYIWKNKLDVSEIDNIIANGFLKNYQQAVL